MKYRNAQDILPDKLLKELQQYVSGETIYIPNAHKVKRNGAAYPVPEAFTSSATNPSGNCTYREKL